MMVPHYRYSQRSFGIRLPLARCVFLGRTGVALYGFFCHWVAFLVSGSQCCCSHWIFSFKLPFSARAAGRGSTVELAAAVACAWVAAMPFCDVSCSNGLCCPACPVTPPSLMTSAPAALSAIPSHFVALNGKRVVHHTLTR